MPTPISAIVLTKDEEHNLPRCLGSLQWVDDLLVFDSFSSDGTLPVAQQHGARVVQHPFSNFAAQRNAAQRHALHDWVLFIDADEQVSSTLRDEIEALRHAPHYAENLSACNAYHIQRVHLFSGRWFPDPAQRRITHASRAALRRNEVPRLFDRRQATWERALHEVVYVPEPHGVLDGVIYHYATTNLSRIYESVNYYSDLEAAYLHQSRQHATLIEALFRGLRSFVYHYLFTQLFRYGEQGFLMASLHGYTKFLMYAKLAERLRIQHDHGVWTEQDRALLHQFAVESRLPPPAAAEPSRAANTSPTAHASVQQANHS